MAKTLAKNAGKTGERVKVHIVTRSRREAAETVKYLEMAQIQAFFDVIKSKRDTAVFRCIYHLGLRAGELALINMDDVGKDYEGKLDVMVRRKKRGKNRRFTLVPAAATPLRAWLRERGNAPGPVFRSRKGSGLSQQRLDVLMKRYGAAAGLPAELCHTHVLRHSCATSLLERGIDIAYIQEHLGHRDLKNTQIYLHVTKRAEREIMRGLQDWR